MQLRIAIEERKILIAQRKLETIRLLSELFNRIKVQCLNIYFTGLIMPRCEVHSAVCFHESVLNIRLY